MIVVFGYNLNIINIFLSTDEKLILRIYVEKEICYLSRNCAVPSQGRCNRDSRYFEITADI